MNRRNALLLLVLIVLVPALASCSSMGRIEVPKEVKVQVSVPCVDPAKRPMPPAIVQLDDLMAMDRGTRTLRAIAALERLQAYVAELEAIVEGCSRIPAQGSTSTGGPPMQKL